IPKVAARVKDLQNPTRKMSKSEGSAQGTILLLDDLKDIERKVKRAVTDAESEVRYDVEAKPGVSNLLELLGAATGRSPDEVAAGYTQYGPLKADTAAAVVELVRPIQERYRELAADPGGTAAVLEKGAAKAESMASATLARAREHIGLLPR
ncbi:MAG: tryptophanyl-tRNA synthetase, partial [Acidimicrobiaceae bacterium]|nr:tryptophanyl-tRNA synthetase [Acidimicrobiaceae bacterium]